MFKFLPTFSKGLALRTALLYAIKLRQRRERYHVGIKTLADHMVSIVSSPPRHRRAEQRRQRNIERDPRDPKFRARKKSVEPSMTGTRFMIKIIMTYHFK